MKVLILRLRLRGDGFFSLWRRSMRLWGRKEIPVRESSCVEFLSVTPGLPPFVL